MSVMLQAVLGLILVGQNPLFMLLFVILAILFKKRTYWVILFLLLFFLIRLNCPIIEPDFNKPFTVISYTNQSVLLRQGFNNYQGFLDEKVNPGERITIEGSFEFKSQSPYSGIQQLNHQYSGLRIKSIQKINSDLFVQKLSQFVINRPLISRLLFQSKIETESSILTLLYSSGLLFSSIIHSLRQFIALFMSQKKQRVLILLILFLFVFVTGFRFVLVRLIIKEFLSFSKFKSTKRTFIETIACLFLYPFAYREFAFIFPFFYRLSYFIFENTKLIRLKQSFFILLIQLTINFKASLFQTFLFTLFRPLSPILLIIDLMGINHSSVSSLFVKLEQFDFIIRGQLLWPLTLLIMLLFVFRTSIKDKLILISVIGCLFFVYTQFNGFTRVVFIDVGQGDATLLIAPYHNEVILIDTGRKNQLPNLIRTLNQYGIRKIDTLIITHDDADHSDNRESLANKYQITTIIDSKDQQIQSCYFHVKSYLMNTDYEDDNDNSIVFSVSFLETSFLFLGDISKTIEKQLITQHPELKIDVLKLAHHGSNTSSDEYFISRIKPEYAIISSDPNTYGHPHIDVLETLRKYQIKTLKTYEESNIVFTYSRWLNSIVTSNRFLLIK